MADETEAMVEALVDIHEALADAKGKVHKGKILGILDALAQQERDDQKMLSILEVLQGRPSLDNQTIAFFVAEELAKDRPPQVVTMPTATGAPTWLLAVVLALAFAAGMMTMYVLAESQGTHAVSTQQAPAKKGR